MDDLRQREQHMEQVLAAHHPGVLQMVHWTRSSRRWGLLLTVGLIILGGILTATSHNPRWLAYGLTVFCAFLALQVIVFFTSAAIVGHYLGNDGTNHR